jgi:hypothetical protein
MIEPRRRRRRRKIERPGTIPETKREKRREDLL